MTMSTSRMQQASPPWTDSGTVRYAVITVFVIGILLRLSHYLGNRSLWLDEAKVALNVRDHSLAELLYSLDHRVLAPYGFLSVEKLFTALFGHTEYALRLFPLIASVLALFLFYRLSTRVSGKVPALIGLALLSVSNWSIFYSAEVKQYSSDAAIALLLYLLAHAALEQWTPRRVLALALAGCVAVWFSHPAAFVLGAIGLVFGARFLAQQDWARVVQVATLSGAWLASFLAILFITPAGDADLLDHMQSAIWNAYFMPLPPRPGWLLNAFFDMLRHPAGFALNGIAAFLLIMGVHALWRNNRIWLALLVLPLLLALAASALRMYPFTGRLLLFAAPALLLLIATGVESLRKSLWRTHRAAWVTLILLLFLHPTLGAVRTAFAPTPYEREDMKTVLQYIQQQRRVGDHLYVYYGAEEAFRFYAPRYDLTGHPVRFGKLPRSVADYLDDALAPSGTDRVWVVFSHVADRIGVNERALLLYLLDTVGTRLDAREAKGASVYLYDLPAEGIRALRQELLHERQLVQDSG